MDGSIVPGSKKDLIDPKLEPFGKGGKESIVYESVPSKGKGSEYQRAERIIVRQYEGTSPKTGKPMYTQKTFIPNRTFVKDIASHFGYKEGGSIIASKYAFHVIKTPISIPDKSPINRPISTRYQVISEYSKITS